MKNQNYFSNSVELGVSQIRNYIPGLIDSFTKSLEKNATKSFSELILKIYNDDKSFLNFKYHREFKNNLQNWSIDQVRKLKDLDFLYIINPLAFVSYFDSDSYNNFFKDFFSLNNILHEDLRNATDDFLFNSKNMNNIPFTDIRAPILIDINISEMANSLLDESGWSVCDTLPRIGVKSVENHDLSKFLQLNTYTYDNQDHEFNWDINNVLNSGNIDNQLSLDNDIITEELIVQIDYPSLANSIIKLYDKIFIKTIWKFVENKTDDEFKRILDQIYLMLSNLDISLKLNLESKSFDYWKSFLNQIEDYNSKDKFNILCTPYLGFVTIVKLLQTIDPDNLEWVVDSKTNEMVQSEPNFEQKFVIELKNCLKEKLERFSDKVTTSTIFTFLAKVGRNEGYDKYNIHKDIMADIMNSSLEDQQYTSKILSSLEREKKYSGSMLKLNGGDRIRKQLLDYIMINKVIQDKSNPKSVIQNPNKPHHNQLHFNIRYGREIAGGTIYKFFVRNIQEIYSNMTYTANSNQNIVGSRSGKYIFKDTLELAKLAIDKFIKDISLKHDIESLLINKDCSKNSFYDDNEIEEKFFSTINSYKTNALKNHRALAVIYKVSLQSLLKLLYHLEQMKNAAKFNNLDVTNLHDAWYQKYEYLVEDLKFISNALKSFKYHNDFSNNLNINKICFPQAKFILEVFLSGDWSANSSLHDSFMDISKEFSSSLKRNYILANAFIESYLYNNDSRFNTNKEPELEYKEIANKYFDSFVDLYKTYSNTKATDEMVLEFDTDDDIVKTLNNFSQMKDTELIALNKDLLSSYEELHRLSQESLQNYTYLHDIKDFTEKAVKFIETTDTNKCSLEIMAYLSSIMTGYEQNLNLEIDSKEQIDLVRSSVKKFNDAIYNFSKKYINSLDE